MQTLEERASKILQALTSPILEINKHKNGSFHVICGDLDLKKAFELEAYLIQACNDNFERGSYTFNYKRETRQMKFTYSSFPVHNQIQ